MSRLGKIARRTFLIGPLPLWAALHSGSTNTAAKGKIPVRGFGHR